MGSADSVGHDQPAYCCSGRPRPFLRLGWVSPNRSRLLRRCGCKLSGSPNFGDFRLGAGPFGASRTGVRAQSLFAGNARSDSSGSRAPASGLDRCGSLGTGSMGLADFERRDGGRLDLGCPRVAPLAQAPPLRDQRFPPASACDRRPSAPWPRWQRRPIPVVRGRTLSWRSQANPRRRHRGDSETSYNVVQVVPGSFAFFSRHRRVFRALVVFQPRTNGRALRRHPWSSQPATAPDRPDWCQMAAFDPWGYTSYRIVMAILATLSIVALFLVLAAFVDEPWP